ncbi:MAG: hypothetical protein DRP93_07185, partial [Candidatus Neomarinimicrobiota bacterium]
SDNEHTFSKGRAGGRQKPKRRHQPAPPYPRGDARRGQPPLRQAGADPGVAPSGVNGIRLRSSIVVEKIFLLS